MAAPHHPGHAGSRRVGSAAFKRRKKLSLAACASACLKCAICSPACYGTANTVCNTPSTGPTGGAPTNSWPSSTTTENANIPCLIAFDCSCLIDIYNCSTRLSHRDLHRKTSTLPQCPPHTCRPRYSAPCLQPGVFDPGLYLGSRSQRTEHDDPRRRHLHGHRCRCADQMEEPTRPQPAPQAGPAQLRGLPDAYVRRLRLFLPLRSGG